MKYELMDDAKEAAKKIATAFENKKLNKRLIIDMHNPGDDQMDFIFFINGADDDFNNDRPNIEQWLELADVGLIKMQKNEGGYEVLLRQELLNAVASEFTISDFYLPIGKMAVSMDDVANLLKEKLGSQFISNNPELREAIDALRASNEANRVSAFTAVYSSLSGLMENTANLVTILPAIPAFTAILAHILSRLG